MKWPWSTQTPFALTPLEGYERWATTYDSETNPIKNASNDLIQRMTWPLKGKAILDAGCGTGYFCRWAEQQQASEIQAVDLSPAMIVEAERTCRDTTFRCGDVSTMVFEKSSFDIIVCALVLGHIADLSGVLQNLLPALRVNGRIVVTDFHPFLTLSQAKRTFRDTEANRTFEIQHCLHLFKDYVSVFRHHDIRLVELEEPVWNDVPVVFGLVGEKIPV